MKKIVALIGKAGAGKDAILKKIKELRPNWNVIVSCTTRPKREGEIEGVDYHFISPVEFEYRLLNDQMLEAAFFNNWCYGTPTSSIKEGVNIGVFNPEGYATLSENPRLDVIGFYITCDDKIRMLRQLNREEHPNVAEIVRRYGTDEKDFCCIEDCCNLIAIDNTTQPLEKIAADIIQYLVLLGAEG